MARSFMDLFLGSFVDAFVELVVIRSPRDRSKAILRMRIRWWLDNRMASTVSHVSNIAVQSTRGDAEVHGCDVIGSRRAGQDHHARVARRRRDGVHDPAQ